MNLIVKKATLADAEYIALLGRITFSETFGHLFANKEELETYLQNTFNVAKIRSSLQKENNVFWLALADELPVGYAKLKKYSPLEKFDAQQTAQLQKIYVLKDFLDKKVGIALYKALAQEVTALQKKYLWLVVLHTNQRAIQFYERSGFKKLQKHIFTIGSQEFQFELMLKEK